MYVFPTKMLLAADGSRSSTPVLGPAGQIDDFTREENIGLVVVGGRDLGRLWYAIRASLWATVIREACCSARVVPGESGA
jgi:nucleotide-binding universal stress UspA family protein